MKGTIEKLNLVYTLEGKIYINLTNKCTNRCVFCIREFSNEVEGKNLWLANENYSIDDVVEQFEKVLTQNISAKNVVFCGFGEPLIKFDMFCEISKYIRERHPDISIRVNTNGQANLIHKKNIVPELAKFADEVSVSLNAESKELYNEISQPKDRENAYQSVKDFIKSCVSAGIKTTTTVVSGCEKAPVNIEECKKIADSLGAAFRVREWLPKGY